MGDVIERLEIQAEYASALGKAAMLDAIEEIKRLRVAQVDTGISSENKRLRRALVDMEQIVARAAPDANWRVTRGIVLGAIRNIKELALRPPAEIGTSVGAEAASAQD
jgi:hypothetical protein